MLLQLFPAKCCGYKRLAAWYGTTTHFIYFAWMPRQNQFHAVGDLRVWQTAARDADVSLELPGDVPMFFRRIPDQDILLRNIPMTPVATTSESEILGRVIAPESPTYSRAAAEAIQELHFTQQDRSRMDDLAAKAQAGTLSAEERAAIESYERVGTFLALLKSKARRSLKDEGFSAN